MISKNRAVVANRLWLLTLRRRAWVGRLRPGRVSRVRMPGRRREGTCLNDVRDVAGLDERYVLIAAM
eukprot:6191634-Pleurochrysis_carterae.AAC.2